MKRRIAHPRGALLLCLALIALGMIVLVACAPAPTPSPTATPQPTFTPQPPPAEDDWTRIKAAGVIQVASPLDNPPFNYYNDNLRPDGFDVALMNNLARRMNLRVEYVDVPFEGLLGSLQLGQADAAVGAMAITKDRLAQADFSQTYYVGEDGILAAPGSGITSVATKADVVNQRVGTIRGSVYEWFLTENLIKTGDMPAKNLFVYTRPEDAVQALGEGRVDLVILDREAALNYESQGLGTVVGKSQYTQNFGIPLRQGSTLLPHLNKALAAALADDTVSGLIEEYLDIAKDDQVPIPTPTPGAAATATPGPTATPVPGKCTNGTEFKADVDINYPDGTVMQPGQKFTKTWRIYNVGCDWTTAYSFVNVPGKSTGGSLGGQTVPVTVPVPKGASWDVSVPMQAPTTPGTYTSYWQMQQGQTGFGKQVWVEIVVQGPTPVPAPTKTPPPGVSFWADNTQLKAGQSTWIHWVVQNVKEIFFYQEGQSWQGHGVTSPGDQQVWPPATTTYYLRVVYNNGKEETFPLKITVTQTQQPPVITQFESDPEHDGVLGQPINFWWAVQGATDEVRLFRNGTQVYKGTMVQGSWSDNQPPQGTLTYELQAKGPGGSATPAKRTINMAKPPPPEQPPQILRFDSNPQGEMVAGNCVDLSWDIQGEVQGLELKYDGGQPGGNLLPVESPGGRSYHDCECPSKARNCQYALHAWGPGGDSGVRTVSIDVKEPQQPPKITSFETNPQDSVPQGQCVDVSWEIQGEWDQDLTLKVNGALVVAGPGPSNYQDCECPKNVQNCVYELHVSGPGGEDNESRSVEVIMQTLPGNPAATFCTDHGGQYNPDDNTCTLNDGTVCDAWAYTNGECPAQQ
jgi:ABC-type amino acid transport substrate-binding protein/putative hemolysin